MKKKDMAVFIPQVLVMAFSSVVNILYMAGKISAKIVDIAFKLSMIGAAATSAAMNIGELIDGRKDKKKSADNYGGEYYNIPDGGSEDGEDDKKITPVVFFALIPMAVIYGLTALLAFQKKNSEKKCGN